MGRALSAATGVKNSLLRPDLTIQKTLCREDLFFPMTDEFFDLESEEEDNNCRFE
jgi:hypothetical protein